MNNITVQALVEYKIKRKIIQQDRNERQLEGLAYLFNTEI